MTEDQYWRFPDQRTATAALVSASIIRSGSTEALIGTLDWVGSIGYGGKFDYAARRLVSPPLVYSGYHVNYRGPVVARLAPYRVYPTVPARKFA